MDHNNNEDNDEIETNAIDLKDLFSDDEEEKILR